MLTREEYLDILRASDDHAGCEFPTGFDYEEARRRAVLLANRLERKIGMPCKLETGSYIQDASFHSMIVLPTPDAPDSFQSTLRLSNFGDLATISDEGSVDPVHLHIVTSCLAELGYQYIPLDVLQEKYDGENRVLRGVSWWIRYFDYL